MIKLQCEVCKENDHKYRCPKCRILYCSLVCYKSHKESCESKEEKENKETLNKADAVDRRVPVFELMEDESEDRVPEDRLHLLRESSELKETLENPHLRQIMSSLVTSENPSKLLEEAMQEPIFTEFADKCLSIIDENKDNQEDST